MGLHECADCAVDSVGADDDVSFLSSVNSFFVCTRFGCCFVPGNPARRNLLEEEKDLHILTHPGKSQ